MKEFLDNLNIRGRLTVYDWKGAGTRRDGPKGLRLVQCRGRILHKDENVVTTLGRKRVAELLTGVSTDFVTDMALGDGGAPQSDLLTPIVPVLSDTVLAHELIRNPMSSATVNGQTAVFLASFLTASLTPLSFIDPANQVINEAGLFTSDNILFARKTFPSIPFSPADRVGVIAEWEIEVL
jgi:hypothetical protein